MRFTYSFNKDYQEAKNMKDNPKEYEGLSSVVWSNFTLIGKAKAFILGNLSILRIYYVWLIHQKEVKNAFKKHKLKLPQVICYIYNFGYQGWFDTDTNTIHVRFTKSPNNDLAESIIHELVHLATYKKEYDYNKRETVVDRYLEKMNFSFMNFKRQKLN